MITDPTGKTPATSVGPKGNIGMPSSPEDIKYLRDMLAQTAQRLTNDELDELAKSLADFKSSLNRTTQ